MRNITEQAAGRSLVKIGGSYDKSSYPHIVDSADWLMRIPAERTSRENTFTGVIGRLNAISDYTGPYRDVGILKELTRGSKLETLGEVMTNCDDDAKDALAEAQRDFPVWANMPYPSRGAPVWGMILEGYGLYLGKKHGQKDREKEESIRRTFVLAFEAVAFTEFRESPLVNDVLGWMIEEKESFPPEIARQLETH